MSLLDRSLPLLWGSGAALMILAVLLSPSVLGRMVAPQWTAEHYQRVANQLPPASALAKRYHAIAQALLQGGRTYSYTTEHLPMLAPQGESTP